MFDSVIQTFGLIVAGAAGLVILLFLLGHPEITFALFLSSYVIEGGELIPRPLDLTSIFLLTSFAGFLLPAVKGKPIRFSLKPSDFWLFMFLVVLFGGSYLVPHPQGGVTKAALFTVAVFLPYLMARLFFKTGEQIRVFLITILSLAVGVAVLLITMSVLSSYRGGRLQFLEANPIPTGTLLAVGLVIAAIALISGSLNSGKSKAFHIAAIPLCLYGILLSGVRGPLISIIVSLAFYCLIVAPQRLRVLAIVSFVTIPLLVTSNYWFPHLPNIGDYSVHAIKQGLSTQERLECYRVAAELFGENPLMGVGTDGYAQLTGLSYPHNIFLEVGSENGLIGLLVFVCFLGSITWYGLRWLIGSTSLDPQSRAIGLTVLVLALTLLVEKQISYGLTMHKDLFAFLGLVVNLPLVARTSPHPKRSTTQ